MVPYVINTTLSCLFVFLGTRDETHKKKINIWVVLAIFIPAILAGARDYTVGTDTLVYGVPFFDYALKTDFQHFVNNIWGGDLLYNISVYFVSILTNDVFWLFFLIETTILFFTYKSLIQYELGRYTWIGFLVFHLLFYSFTLNLMRQFICISIEVYAFKYIKQHKLTIYCLICMILFFVQKTALLGLLIYPMYRIISEGYFDLYRVRVKTETLKLVVKILIVACVCITIVFGRDLIIHINELFDGAFFSQVQNIGDSFNFVIKILIYMLPILFVLLFYSKSISQNQKDFEFFVFLIVLYVLFWQLQGISKESYRVGLIFGYFLVIAIPLLIKNIVLFREKVLIFLFLTAIMIVFYFDYFVVNLYNETYPYTSELLGIVNS